MFAHPDDEAFGPAGALLMESRGGSDLHLICATPGEAGANPDKVTDLAQTRLGEWRQSGEIIGAQSMHQLGYRDGHLDNHSFHQIAQRAERIIREILEGSPAMTPIDIISYDLGGISGHLDHILMARVACFVGCSLRADFADTKIRLYCLPDSVVPVSNCNWLYMEAGRPAHMIHQTIDASAYKTEIIECINSHVTQRHDAEFHKNTRGDSLWINNFVVL